ncbi:MAG: 37S ribosomal protein S9, mitochondrial [Sclerophora amabilis]|nr:MAG: 37S ribosomal protein S9, mitochondrial [Sclerophora amabilis]
MGAILLPAGLQASISAAFRQGRAVSSLRIYASRASNTCAHRSSRALSTSPRNTAIAAPEINFNEAQYGFNPRGLRIVPESPSYFTTKPEFTDDLLALQDLLRRNEILPTVPAAHAPRVAWKTMSQYRLGVAEPVKASRYSKIVRILQRLNLIHQSVMPDEVKDALDRYKRDMNPFENVARPQTIDQYGRSVGAGRRKSSTARVWLVEGEGEVLINGKTLMNAFPRIHDRESAIWALKTTQRIDKYNVWALVKGGGTTGQAEALTLGLAKALIVHEPLLKPALRRGEFSPFV